MWMLWCDVLSRSSYLKQSITSGPEQAASCHITSRHVTSRHVSPTVASYGTAKKIMTIPFAWLQDNDNDNDGDGDGDGDYC